MYPNKKGVTKTLLQVDPLRDTETIFHELRLKDIEYLTNNLDKVQKIVTRMGDKDKAAICELEAMKKVHTFQIKFELTK